MAYVNIAADMEVAMRQGLATATSGILLWIIWVVNIRARLLVPMDRCAVDMVSVRTVIVSVQPSTRTWIAVNNARWVSVTCRAVVLVLVSWIQQLQPVCVRATAEVLLVKWSAKGLVWTVAVDMAYATTMETVLVRRIGSDLIAVAVLPVAKVHAMH